MKCKGLKRPLIEECIWHTFVLQMKIKIKPKIKMMFKLKRCFEMKQEKDLNKGRKELKHGIKIIIWIEFTTDQSNKCVLIGYHRWFFGDKPSSPIYGLPPFVG
jgi:hypothetical protein